MLANYSMKPCRSITKSRVGLLLTFLLGLGCADRARADQIFATPPGAVEPATGQAVSASVDFSLTGTTLTIKLSDTLVGIQDAGQLLTDVFFTLSDTGSPSLFSQSGDLVQVDFDNKTKVQTVTDLGTSDLGWGFGAATVNVLNGFELCVICQGGPTAPATPSDRKSVV